MLILPCNALPFIWDSQSTQHWAFVLLMFRGLKRVKGLGALGNWYSQKSIMPMLKTVVWPDWIDKVHQRKTRQKNLYIITYWDDYEDNSVSLHLSVTDWIRPWTLQLPTPEAQYRHTTDRRKRLKEAKGLLTHEKQKNRDLFLWSLKKAPRYLFHNQGLDTRTETDPP